MIAITPANISEIVVGSTSGVMKCVPYARFFELHTPFSGTNTKRTMTESPPERRRHARFPLGLPVGVRLAGRRTPLVVELLDVSESGARFHALEGDAGVHVS